MNYFLLTPFHHIVLHATLSEATHDKNDILIIVVHSEANL